MPVWFIKRSITAVNQRHERKISTESRGVLLSVSYNGRIIMLLKSGCRITHTHTQAVQFITPGLHFISRRATITNLWQKLCLLLFSSSFFSFSLIKKMRGKHKGGESRTENKVNHLIFTAKTKRFSNHAERQSAAFCPCIPSTFCGLLVHQISPSQSCGTYELWMSE